MGGAPRVSTTTSTGAVRPGIDTCSLTVRSSIFGASTPASIRASMPPPLLSLPQAANPPRASAVRAMNLKKLRCIESLPNVSASIVGCGPARQKSHNPAMSFRPFAIERLFARWEFQIRHLLSSSDCETITIAELLALAGWSADRVLSLRLSYTDTQGEPPLRERIAALYPGLA